jgi:hypothetical protein
MGGLNLTLMIPGAPSTMLVGQALFIGFTVMLLLVRKMPFQIRFTSLEWVLLLLLLCVVQVYLRNPVGLSIFGGGQIGGRPYAMFMIAFMTCFFLCGIRVPAKELRLAMKLFISGAVLSFFVGLLGWLVPTFGVWVGAATSTGESSLQEGIMEDRTRVRQLGFIAVIPVLLARWVSSFVNPIKACFSLKWAPLVFLSLFFAGASGYRNVVGAVGLTYLVGLFYRGRLPAVFAAGLMGIVALAGLALVNVALPLPPNIQRSLSFLPGTWDEQYRRSTDESTDWRVEMWKEALLTDRWIQNKTVGDGLGFSAKELEVQAQLNAMKRGASIGTSGLDITREYFMVAGDYHSGPVSSIRTIGYVGLAIMTLAQILIAIHAHRQIVRCRGTDWYPVALFFGIPTIWHPVFFWLVFGTFNQDSVVVLINLGMIRLLENCLPLPAYVSKRREAYSLQSQGRVPEPAFSKS